MTLFAVPVQGKLVLIVALVLAVIVTAIGVVYTKHLNRNYFAELQRLQIMRDEMNIEWGQLQLERSTFATSSEIERSARENLGMRQPAEKEIVTVKP